MSLLPRALGFTDAIPLTLKRVVRNPVPALTPAQIQESKYRAFERVRHDLPGHVEKRAPALPAFRAVQTYATPYLTKYARGVWHVGFPPVPGDYIASTTKDAKVHRHFDGRRWSMAWGVVNGKTVTREFAVGRILKLEVQDRVRWMIPA